MAYIIEHPMECAVCFMALVLFVGTILIIRREKKTARQNAEAQDRLLRRIEEISNSMISEKARMERELKEAYDATNRVVAELVRAQQMRLDAFSGQMESWQANEPAAPDARIDELLTEVRRTGDMLHGSESAFQNLATRAEMGTYFADLEKGLREIEDMVRAIAVSGEPDVRMDELLTEVRRMSDALHDEKLSVQGVATQEEMGKYFVCLENELRRIENEVCAITVSKEKDHKADKEKKNRGSEQNEMDLLNDALKRVKKRLRQANKSMEEAARHSKRAQKKMIRDAGENE